MKAILLRWIENPIWSEEGIIRNHFIIIKFVICFKMHNSKEHFLVNIQYFISKGNIKK